MIIIIQSPFPPLSKFQKSSKFRQYDQFLILLSSFPAPACEFFKDDSFPEFSNIAAFWVGSQRNLPSVEGIITSLGVSKIAANTPNVLLFRVVASSRQGATS